MRHNCVDRLCFGGVFNLSNAKWSPKVLTGTEIPGREKLYISLHSHHQNDSCIKMGSDESPFNVSLIVRDKVTKTASINHTV